MSQKRENPEWFPLCNPQPLNTILLSKFAKAAHIVKMTTNLMRDLGSIPSPQNSFYLGVGLETLHLRMERHYENTCFAGFFTRPYYLLTDDLTLYYTL